MRTAGKATLSSVEAHLRGNSSDRSVVVVRVVKDGVAKLAHNNIKLFEDCHYNLSYGLVGVGAC
jgi:hypothetical protein